MNDSKATVSKQMLAEWLPTSEGWLSLERAYEMYDLVRQIQPAYVVEIGVFGGRSLIAQALALKDIGKGKIIGIDPWKKETAVTAQPDDDQAAWWRDNVDYYRIHQGCMEAVWKFSLDRFVNIIRASSQECADLIPRCDIIYIDGGHSEESSCRDVEIYLPKVKQNGSIWFDDADWKTTQKALAMLDAKCKMVRDCVSYRLYCKA
jgi:predicted O-methyltransferase YrrM